MTLDDISTLLNLTIRCDRYPWGWAASFKDCEIKDDGILIGAYGKGDTPDQALAHYVEQIRGQTIVHNAMKPNRREYTIPTTLHTEQEQPQ